MSKNAGQRKALPEGWQEVQLESIVSLRKEKFDPVTRGENVTCIELEHIEKGTGRIIASSLSNNKQSIKSVFFSEDILFGKLRPLLRKFAFPKFDGVCTSEILVFKVNTDICFQKFVFYLVQSDTFNKVACRTTGTKMPRVDWRLLKRHPVAIPSLEEQKTIASLLEKWDTAIEKTETLIKAKEKQFKWLLKTLINDQQNNPKWKKIKLGDVGLISSAGIDKKIVEGEIPVRLVNYLDVLRKDFISSDDVHHWVTAPERKKLQCDVRKGDIFFTPSSEIRGDIAHSAVATEDIKDAVYSYHIIRFRLKENWDLLFKAYAFKSSWFLRQAYRLCEGSGQRYVISQNYFRGMMITIPDLKEQIRIGRFLATSQKEINLLKEISNQYRHRKQGLMQKLLTGTWRVKK